MRAIASTITAALETALEMAFAAVGLLIVISSGPFVLRAASQGTTTVSLALDTFANTIQVVVVLQKELFRIQVHVCISLTGDHSMVFRLHSTTWCEQFNNSRFSDDVKLHERNTKEARLQLHVLPAVESARKLFCSWHRGCVLEISLQ